MCFLLALDFNNPQYNYNAYTWFESLPSHKILANSNSPFFLKEFFSSPCLPQFQLCCQSLSSSRTGQMSDSSVPQNQSACGLEKKCIYVCNMCEVRSKI